MVKEQNLEKTEVLVVGAGLTTAYQLSKSGKKSMS